MTLHEPCVLLKLGEIVLKGKNRQRFERLLHENIRRPVRDLGIADPDLAAGRRDRAADRRRRVSAAPAMETAADLLAERMRNVMGLARVCRAVRVAKDPAAAAAAAVELTAGRPGAFAVRARRRDKRFPLTSGQLAALIGSRIQQEYGYPVNLRHPDTTVFVEVDQSEVFVFTEGRPGQGGLPVSMSGRALVLMSGGIDSPVAAYRMMRRGLRCDYLHFSGMPADRPGVGVQGLRPGPPAGQVPGRFPAVRGRVRQGAATARVLRSRAAADHGSAAADAQDRRGAGAAAARGPR